MRRHLRRLGAVFLLAAGIVPAPGQDRIAISRLDAPELRGVFTGFAADGGILVRAEGGMVTVPAAELVAVTWSEAPMPSPPGSVRLDLAGGDVLHGQVEQGSFDEVALSTFAAGQIRILLDHIAVASPSSFPGGAPDLPARKETREDEIFIDAGGRLDRHPGEVIRLDRSGVVFQDSGGAERHFEWKRDRVVGVRLAQSEAPKSSDASVCVALFRDGSRLTGALSGVEDGSARLKLPIGPTVSPDRRALKAIEYRSAAFRFLSDLEPAAVRRTPWFEGGPERPLAPDRGPGRDGVLRIGSATFRKGIAAQARTELTWDLGGKFAKFSAQAGADPATQDRPMPGSVRIVIQADGKEVWKSPLLDAGAEPVPVEIGDLAQARKLTILVDFGESGPTGTFAILGDAMLRSR